MAGTDFIEHAAGAIQRLLPHIQVAPWTEGAWTKPQCVWTSPQRTEVRVTVAVGHQSEQDARSLTTTVRRRRVPVVGGTGREVIDVREHDICRLIALRISQVMERRPANTNGDASIRAIRDAFDESVVASHIQEHHELMLPVTSVLLALHTLSEQSYENKALTFGCILDPNKTGQAAAANFPSDFLRSKRYKALSDGFRTAYVVSTEGLHHLPRSAIVALILGQTGRLDYAFLDHEIHDVMYSEVAEGLYQAISRGNSRNTINGAAGEQVVDIVIPEADARNVLPLLQHAMPGVRIQKVDPGFFVRQPRRNAKTYIEYVALRHETPMIAYQSY